ncbi:hypothetical protein DKP78_24320, partial [Enterococcus faecium]
LRRQRAAAQRGLDPLEPHRTGLRAGQIGTGVAHRRRGIGIAGPADAVDDDAAAVEGSAAVAARRRDLAHHRRAAHIARSP